MKQFLFFSYLLVALCSTFFCNTALSKNVYLSSKGNNSNDGLSGDKPVQTFKKAYLLAAAGDVIQVSGIIDLSSEVSNAAGLPVVKNLTIQGVSKDTDGFNGNSATKLFTIKDGCTVTLKNLALKNGSSIEPGTHGGALSVLGNAVVHGDNLLFTGNKADGAGGAIQIASTKGIHLKNCIFSGNEASRGGAIGIMDSANDGVVFLLENCAFVSNKAVAPAGNGGGSAIHSMLGAQASNNTINIINSTFTQNATASANGGTIYFHTGKSEGVVNIINCTVAKNTSEGTSVNNGAGIFMANTQLKLNIYNSIIEGNSIAKEAIFADLRMVAPPSSDNLSVYNSFVGRYAGTIIENADLALIAPEPSKFNYLSNSSTEKNLRAKLGSFDTTNFYYPLKQGSPAVNFGNSAYLSDFSSTDQAGNVRSYTNGKCAAGAIEKTEISLSK